MTGLQTLKKREATAKRRVFFALVICLCGCADILVGGLSTPGDDTNTNEPNGKSDPDTVTDSEDSVGSSSATTSTENDTYIPTDEEDSENNQKTDTDSNPEFDTGSDTNDDTESESAGDSETEIIWCELEDTYDTFDSICYVDSVNGDDTNSGLSPSEPVKTQEGIRSGCKVARFKRGSRFNEPLAIRSTIEVYTNYGDKDDPLPKFIVPDEPMSGPVISAIPPPTVDSITIDGLYVAGARSDGTIEHINGGICVFLGANSQFLNSEITDCEVGAMIIGENAVFKGNYVHDMILGIEPERGGDPNTAGGAEGIFVNASNNEIAYNTFINCSAPVSWIEGESSCDGGATEVTINACSTVSNVNIHHNYSYNSCGFTEISTSYGDCEVKGGFSNSQIYHNVSIDSAWLGFLQVNNTDFENIQFNNNTVVHHQDSTSAGLLWIIYTDYSSGWTGGELLPQKVFLNNNLFVFDDVSTYGDPIDENFAEKTNLLLYTEEHDPGFINIDGTHATDYDILSSSPAVDSGTYLGVDSLDFVNRSISESNGAPDIGAFEYGAPQEECLHPRMPQ